MKKTYLIPNTKPLNLLADNLLVVASKTEAASDAEALSRQNGNQGGSFWDDSE